MTWYRVAIRRSETPYKGAVRSAELEYGKNAFELVAINGDDDVYNSNGHGDDEDDTVDKLVLRAQNSEEMKQIWTKNQKPFLFQFRESNVSLFSFLIFFFELDRYFRDLFKDELI